MTNISQKTLLIADDDTAICTVLSHTFRDMPIQVKITQSAEELCTWITQGLGDCVLSDVTMQDGNGLEILSMAGQKRPDLPVIIMSAQNTVLTAIKASSQGAFEYVPKPFDLEHLKTIVERALQQKNTVLNTEQTCDLPIIGSSPSMQILYRSIARLVPLDETALIHGESGVGKELVARTLHDFGGRKNKPFVPLNMGAIPKDLIEAELFGYEKGAFTGADTARQGKFLQADGGTLFLDEIGDMPLESQTRLLRVLQEGEVTPIGSTRTYKCNVRIISASHRDLGDMVKNGTFRTDLYYRLNVVPLYIPALRERTDDIQDLIAHFQNTLKSDGLEPTVFTKSAMAKLKSYAWPGNVRELENFVRRTSIMLSGVRVDADDVDGILGNGACSMPSDCVGEKPLHSSAVESVVFPYIQHFFENEYGDETAFKGRVHNLFVSQVERGVIQHALYYCKGNQIKASEILGINRNTLRKRIQELHIDIIKNTKP